MSKKLRTWLDENKMRQREFARAIGYSDASVCDWLKGRKRPRPRALAKIIAATGGTVTDRYFRSAK